MDIRNSAKKRRAVLYEINVGNQVCHQHENQLLRDKGSAGAEIGLEDEARSSGI